jgi:hypothetical protein
MTDLAIGVDEELGVVTLEIPIAHTKLLFAPVTAVDLALTLAGAHGLDTFAQGIAQSSGREVKRFGQLACLTELFFEVNNFSFERVREPTQRIQLQFGAATLFAVTLTNVGDGFALRTAQATGGDAKVARRGNHLLKLEARIAELAIEWCDRPVRSSIVRSS